MPLAFFKPNSNNTGALLSLEFNSKDGAIWLNIVKQTGESKKAGTFANGARASVKLNQIEAAGLISAVQRNAEFNTFHSTDNSGTGIIFKPYYKKTQTDGKWVEDLSAQEGFGLLVNREKGGQKETFKFGFKIANGEVTTLVEWLRFALGHIFSAIYAADKAKALEYAKKKKSEGGEAQAPTEPAEPAENNEGSEAAEGKEPDPF